MLRKIKHKGSTEDWEGIPGVTAERGRSEGEQRGARKSRWKKPRVRENILTVWVSDYLTIVSWKMRRVIASDAKWAGFDMKSWTGPSDSTCSQPQQGQGSLPHPLSLSAAWPVSPVSAGALQGRGRGRACPVAVIVWPPWPAQAVIADSVYKSFKQNSDQRPPSAGNWGKQRFPCQKQELFLLLFKNAKAKSSPGQ